MTYINKVLVGFAVLACFACTKLIEKDFTNEMLTVVSPQDNSTTPVATQTFWWDRLEGASKYNLQIVSPSFNNVSYFILDTNIALNRYSTVLAPGIYQWRVKAFNDYSSTAYITRSIIIDTTTDLTNYTVFLDSPKDNDSVAAPVKFSWQSIAIADTFLLKVDTISTNKTVISKKVLKNKFSNVLDTSYVSLKTGHYHWSVKAMNKKTYTQFSDQRLVRIK